MNDLEDRLRATLRKAADVVPPSQHARADLERRLSRRRPSRGLVLAVAVAAAVIAGVAVPVALNQDSGSPGGRAATMSAMGGGLPGPVVLGEYTKDGVRWSEVLTVELEEDNGKEKELVCIRSIAPGQPNSGSGGCQEVPSSWPDGPYNGALSGQRGWVSSGRSSSLDLPNLWVTIAAPQVATLEFRLTDGTPVPARMVAETSDVKAFVAETEGGVIKQRGYTAKDAAGNLLEAVGI